MEPTGTKFCKSKILYRHFLTQFCEAARLADGASDLFVQLFGANAGHVRVVYGVHSVPIGTPVMVETIFEIE